MLRATICGFSMLLMSCATPVTSEVWQSCEKECQNRKGVKEACVEFFKGPGCHCNDDKIIWLNKK